MLEGEWMTIDAAAAALGLHRETVLRAIRDGKLEARKVSRVWFITPAAVDAYRAAHLGRRGWDRRKAPGYQPDPKRKARRERMRARQQQQQPATPADKDV
jgi:excisionase family DNA binding protein